MKRLVVLSALALTALALSAGLTADSARAQDLSRETRTYSTPAPLDDLSACADDVACAPALEGAPERQAPSLVWSVRTRGATAEEGYVQPSYPVAIVADVDVDEDDRGRPKDRDRDRDRDRPYPDLRRDSD